MSTTDAIGRRGRVRWVAAALAWAILGGCGEKVQLPQTYPVRGRVVYKGGSPLAGGVVQFQARSDPRLLTNGETDADGNFALTTHVGRRCRPTSPRSRSFYPGPTPWRRRRIFSPLRSPNPDAARRRGSHRQPGALR